MENIKKIPIKRPFPGKIYRSIRKGLIVLPEMEKRLVIDLRRLLSLVADSDLNDWEITYASQNIITVREVVEEMIDALYALRGFLAPHVLEDMDRLERTLVEYMPDLSSEMRSGFMEVVRGYGNVGAIFKSAFGRLRFKRDLLSSSLQQIQKGTKDQLVSAVRKLEDAYFEMNKERYPNVAPEQVKSIDELVKEWEKLLDQAREEIENAKSFWERQDAEAKYYDLLELLCYKYPHIAKAMGMLSEPIKLESGLSLPPLGDKICDKLFRHEIVCLLLLRPLICLVIVLIGIMCSRDCPG